jgi:hypothetical protein
VIVAGLLIAVFAVWFAASAAVQIRVPATRRLRRLDPCQLLPRWNLFSPRPIQSDLVVRYRRWQSRERPGEWHELPYPGTRRLTDGVFSSRRRSRRMLYAQAERVVRLYRRNRSSPRRVIGSAPYLHLLDCVTSHASAEPAWGIQFQVIRVSRAQGEPTTAPLFRSAIHAMPA